MSDPTAEIWRPVVGYEGVYEVSDQGRVRSLDRMIARKDGRIRRGPGRILRTARSGKYLSASLSVGAVLRSQRVHVLVAQAFLGPRPDGMEVCHNNGNPLDNRAENLRYGTRSDNMLDKVLHGGNHWARRTHCEYGHEFTPENTAPIRRSAGRRCRKCMHLEYIRRRDAARESIGA